MQSRILEFLRGGTGDFESLALEVFDFQRAHNSVYRAYCDRHPPVRHWKQIPAVPTSAFKDFEITCFPVGEAVAEFHTSGTTTGQPGRHFFKTLELYDAASRPNFHAHLLPGDLSLLSLVPDSPRSSLVHMIRALGGVFADSLEEVRRPVCVLGTAFHFLNLFDHGLRLQLPVGSRVMETGGFKGRSREVSKRELYRLIEEHLGIPASHVVNEYGMTELSTQFYDRTLRMGQPSNVKDVPPWARVLIIDPRTGQEAPWGERGLIRVFDLANLWSAMCIQTEDIGVAHPEGFEILGRLAGAEVRGCSLGAEG